MATRIKPWQRLSLRDFRFIYRSVPRLCVDVIIRDRRGAVLIQRDIMPDTGRWHVPGGTVHFGETLEQAVRRFANHEAGLRVKILRCLGVVEYFRGKKFGHMVSATYLARPIGGTLHGGWQGRRVAFSRRMPRNTVPEQAEFLIANRLLAR